MTWIPILDDNDHKFSLDNAILSGITNWNF